MNNPFPFDPLTRQLTGPAGSLPIAPTDLLAQDLFSGLEGDLRVQEDTALVTYYNAPRASQWKEHFENLPQRLQNEGVDPRVPWLYNFKLDFRFK